MVQKDCSLPDVSKIQRITADAGEKERAQEAHGVRIMEETFTPAAQDASEADGAQEAREAHEARGAFDAMDGADAALTLGGRSSRPVFTSREAACSARPRREREARGTLEVHRELESWRRAEIAGRVRRLRLGLGYTRQAFADAVGTSRGRLEAWESGAAPLTVPEADALCQTFAASRAWLLDGIGRPFPKLMDAATNLLLCPRAAFLRDETAPFDAQTREKTRRFAAALTTAQRRRALLFYADLVAALALEDAPFLAGTVGPQTAF